MCRFLGRVLYVAMCLLLYACSGLHYATPLDPSAGSLETGKAYMYGRFTLDRDFLNLTRILVRVENVDTGNPVDFPLLAIGNPVYVVEVDPGTYRVKEFLFTPGGPSSMLLSFEVHRFAVPSEAGYLSTPIRLETGMAYYLGDFVGATRRTGFGVGGNIVWVSFGATMAGIKQDFAVTTDTLKREFPALAPVGYRPAYSLEVKPSN